MEYIEYEHRINFLGIQLLGRILELLELFNSSTAQMVLGLSVRHFATSKILTFRKILIASRCLKFVIVFLPIVKTNFRYILKSDSKFCKDFNDIISLYNEQIVKINQKVISIMTEIIDSELSKWMAKPPVPSAYFQTILLHLIQLHDNIQDVLPFYVLVDLFKLIQNIFEELLKKRLEKLKIKNDGGPQYGFVSISFLIQFFLSKS
jgi:vacuolar protein sorting-associated protein 54